MRVITRRRELQLRTELQRFIAEFSNVPFRHSQETFADIANGILTLKPAGLVSAQPIKQLIRTFELRLRRLDRQQAQEYCIRRQTIRDDTASLCDGFQAHLTDSCEFWIFESSSNGCVTFVYVAYKARAVLGVVRGGLPQEAQN